MSATDAVGDKVAASDDLGTARTPLTGNPGELLAAEVAVDRPVVVNGLNLEAFGSALETVAAMRRGRPASPRVFGVTTSSTQKTGTQSRSGSTPGTSRIGVSTVQAIGSAASNKVAQESAILAAVRRQMELLEDKLSGQISRVQQQSDRLRDAALSRVDSKMGTMEALQPKLDRRLAELSGNYKGLSDEMQAQIRRLDQMDSRLWEWRHQLEEEVRGKFVELEQNFQKVQSSVRVMNATSTDSSKRLEQRLSRYEALLEEKLVTIEDTRNDLVVLFGRVDELDSFRLQDLNLMSHSGGGEALSKERDFSSDASTNLLCLETRVSDSFSKLESFMHDLNEMHTRMEAQEERLKSVQTRVETKEEHYRWLNDRVERFDWEGRFKEIQSKIDEHAQFRSENSIQMEVFSKRLEKTDQEFDAVVGRFRGGNVFVEASQAVEFSESQASTIYQEIEGLSLEIKDSLGRVVEVEARCNSLASDIATLQAEPGLAPRVTDLVNQLKNVAPKVIEQEMAMRELLEKVGSLEVEHRMLKTILEQGHTETNELRSFRAM